MASPPDNHNYGSSASSSHPQSRKRSSDMSASAPAVKRRKPSVMSSDSRISVHPLRQTSFPPDGSDGQSYAVRRSTSVDTMSLVSGSAAGGITGKKRGRKPKNKGDDNTSLIDERAPTAVSGASGRGGRNKTREQSAEDEDEDADDNVNVTIAARTAEDKEEEKQHRAMLVAAFDEEQFSRYEVWRSSRLSDNIVRRLVNQTLSQSVPASVILAVKSVTKLYAGEIIERARKIQTQWLDLSGEDQTTGLPSPPALEGEDKAKETRRGPLTPDHLREALRRIKLERDGCVGLLGLGRLQHANGAERFGLKTGGKRLLR
ncbi:MAG: hypothetical protein M1818_002361 [Claussenomyces sp. TS43310]|nr:MAG: hypothetical protein M1818_002361 [Claussenomyces sp. TS43310]